MRRREIVLYILIVLVLVAGGTFAWRLYFQQYGQRDTVNIHHFPQGIGDWRSEELEITDDEYAILETRNAFSRKYTNSRGEIVYLLIVYSQYNRKVSHPPEMCLQGDGGTILERSVTPVSVPGQTAPLAVNRLLMAKRGFRQLVYYVFKAGDTLQANYWRQQWLVASDAVMGKPASSALIRMITPVAEGKEEEAEQRLQAFAQAVLPLLPHYVP